MKRLTILFGFLLTVLGSLDAYLYVTPVERRVLGSSRTALLMQWDSICAYGFLAAIEKIGPHTQA